MQNEKKIVENNSEILFIYDAKHCNPNGDFDDENKPRMDKLTKTNLVSDVRLKRYIRDYLHDFKGKDIFVIQTEKSDKAEKRTKELGGWEEVKEMIDVKFFGALPTEKNKADNLTGPIQFNWGYSLNKVDLMKSSTITSHFKTSGNKEKEGGSGIGKDYRVKYSLIAFSGSLNKANAEKTKLNINDLELFDEAMVKSIPLSRTRSKIGQWPRFYFRIELDNGSFLKDLRELVRLEESENIEKIQDVNLNITDLMKYLVDNKQIIKKIVMFRDNKLRLSIEGEDIQGLKELLEEKIPDVEIHRLKINN